VDKPHNLLPSLHIVYTALTCLAICQQWQRGRRGLCLRLRYGERPSAPQPCWCISTMCWMWFTALMLVPVLAC
jgi:hypothetical protein